MGDISLNVPPSASFCFCTEHGTVWGIPWVTGDLLSPPRLVGWETENALILCKCCSVVTKTSLCYQHGFQQKSKTQPQSSYCEENSLYSSQTEQSLLELTNFPVASQGNSWTEIAGIVLSLSCRGLQSICSMDLYASKQACIEQCC